MWGTIVVNNIFLVCYREYNCIVLGYSSVQHNEYYRYSDPVGTSPLVHKEILGNPCSLNGIHCCR